MGIQLDTVVKSKMHISVCNVAARWRIQAPNMSLSEARPSTRRVPLVRLILSFVVYQNQRRIVAHQRVQERRLGRLTERLLREVDSPRDE